MEATFSEEKVQRILEEQREALKREMASFLQQERKASRWSRRLAWVLVAGGVGVGAYYVLRHDRRQALQREVRALVQEVIEEFSRQRDVLTRAENTDEQPGGHRIEQVLVWTLVGLLTRRLLQWLQASEGGTP